MGMSGGEFLFTLFLAYIFFVVAKALIAAPVTAITGDSTLGHSVGTLVAFVWLTAVIFREYAIVWWGVYLW